MLGKLKDGQLIVANGKILEYNGLIVTNPRDEDWIEAGYKEVVEGEQLPLKDGFYQYPEYTEEEDKIITTYRYGEIVDVDL